MSEYEDSSAGGSPEDDSGSSRPDREAQESGAGAGRGLDVRPSRPKASHELILVAPRIRADFPGGPRPAASHDFLPSRFAIAAATALAAVVAVGGALVVEHGQQARLLAERASETETLAQTVKTLTVRLEAIESAKSRDDLADLRRSVGEMKSTVASARELNGALTQLSQRVDKLDHEEGAKVDKLGERVDHEASALTAELSARIDKLEKKVVAPAPPQPAQTPAPPKFGANVSMEPTGSIERPRPLLHGYIVLDARDDVALIGGRYGEREVRQGDFLPGAGRVERIERKGASWVVLTSEGLIASADLPPY